MSEKEGEIVLRKRERSEIEDTKVGVEKEGRERERERESSGERDEKVMYEEWKIGCGKFKMSGPPNQWTFRGDGGRGRGEDVDGGYLWNFLWSSLNRAE